MNISITAKAAAAATLMMFFAAPMNAATRGETFVFDWMETSPNMHVMGSVDLTLGAASSMSGFFDISKFDITQAHGGFCGVCTPVSENLSGMLFDAATGGVVGDITGSYDNSKGKLHTFTLTTTDQPNGTWIFKDTRNGTTTSMGTYTTAASTGVPEPATLSLLALGLAGVGFARRKRKY